MGSIDITPTEVDTDAWDLFYIPMYFTSASSTATNTVPSTILTKTYVEDSVLCTDCTGSPITYAGTVGSAFDQVVLNYPKLSFDGDMSSADMSVSFDSTWAGTYDATSYTCGLISSYSGDDYVDNTWDGDSDVDAWLGLALDHEGSNESYNILYRLQQQADITNMLFNIDVDLGGTSTL